MGPKLTLLFVQLLFDFALIFLAAAVIAHLRSRSLIAERKFVPGFDSPESALRK